MHRTSNQVNFVLPVWSSLLKEVSSELTSVFILLFLETHLKSHLLLYRSISVVFFSNCAALFSPFSSFRHFTSFFNFWFLSLHSFSPSALKPTAWVMLVMVDVYCCNSFWKSVSSV
ncbi:hypothetical protein CHARACLAT_026039 [Characodon lateralis]|uniref:Uncharacterized protein n=1 Tax=Characodon lateralis TaxID=208331 RepID=A0ABU7DUA4_9TELE|nr:hypothetical protein [Characodon lateralis]